MGLGSKAISRLRALRATLVCSLIVGAIACATACYFVFRYSERAEFLARYGAITGSSAVSITGKFERLQASIQELAVVFGHTIPSSQDWPHAAWCGFAPTAQLLKKASGLDGAALLPILLPSEAADYEAYIKGFYEKDPSFDPAQLSPYVPMGAIWSYSPTTGMPVQDTTGHSPYGARNVLLPLAQYSYSSMTPVHLSNYNFYNNPTCGPPLDEAMSCVELHEGPVPTGECGTVSPMIRMPFDTALPVEDIVGMFAFPIFPAENNTQLVGFAAGALSWNMLLTEVVPSFVNAVDVVVSVANMTFTYTVEHGQARFKSMGDSHDRHYAHYAQLSEINTSHLVSSPDLDLTFYPTHAFAQEYSTQRPLWYALGLVAVFAFCSVVFLLYDFLDQKEACRKMAVLDTKRRFVRFISHEIRTPLNTVRLGLKLLEGELRRFLAGLPRAEEEGTGVYEQVLQCWQQLIADIVESSESAVEVLNDLLNYDKIEIGTLKLEFTCFDVAALTEKVVVAMQVQAQQKNVTLQLMSSAPTLSAATPASSPTAADIEMRAGQHAGGVVVGDVQRVGQVLRNVVSNAVKFTPTDGTVTVTVEVSSKFAPLGLKILASDPLFQTVTQVGTVRLSVRDSGAGLTPKQLEEICAEGVQFNANELQAGQGSGLGLFISKGIVEQHGGRLVVTSEGLGKGATFTIELPLFQPLHRCSSTLTSAPSAAFTHQGSALEQEVPLPPKRLLVVDDSTMNRKLLVRLLTAEGHTCAQAEDGADALKKYSEMGERNETPDAILMDFEMPVMNGPTATAKLREMGCACLIVGITGNVLPADVAAFVSGGADAVLPKPLVMHEFNNLLAADRSPIIDESPPQLLRHKPTAAVVSAKQTFTGGVCTDENV